MVNHPNVILVRSYTDLTTNRHHRCGLTRKLCLIPSAMSRENVNASMTSTMERPARHASVLLWVERRITVPSPCKSASSLVNVTTTLR